MHITGTIADSMKDITQKMIADALAFASILILLVADTRDYGRQQLYGNLLYP